MVDPLEQLNVIGQKALAVPTDLLGIGTRRMTEDMGMLSAKVQDIGATLVLPAGGLGLPQLPALPGMPGATAAAPSTQMRSEVMGKRTPTKQRSYMKV